MHTVALSVGSSTQRRKNMQEFFSKVGNIFRAFDAIDAGADLLKVFPCGSPENISVLKSVIPLPLFAVGGIGKGNKREYLETADGVGVGIGIFRPGQSTEELYESAKEFLEA